MNTQDLSVAQLKYALKQRRLQTSGRKNELIARLLDVDPTCRWIQETTVVDNATVESSEEDTGVPEVSTRERSLGRREAELADKEREVMLKEIELR